MSSVQVAATGAAHAHKRIGPGLALASLGAIAFSGKAIIVKLAYRYGVDAVTLIMLRMLFALPLFALMAWWAGRGKPALTRRDWLGVVGLGFSGYYLSSFLDFAGLAYITASLERLILYLNPTLVLLFGWIALRAGAITRWQAAGMAVSYAGVLLVFGHELQLGQSAAAAWGTLLVLPERGELCGLPRGQRRVRQAPRLAAPGGARDQRGLRAVHRAVPAAAAGGARPSLVAPEVIWLSVLNATYAPRCRCWR